MNKKIILFGIVLLMFASFGTATIYGQFETVGASDWNHIGSGSFTNITSGLGELYAPTDDNVAHLEAGMNDTSWDVITNFTMISNDTSLHIKIGMQLYRDTSSTAIKAGYGLYFFESWAVGNAQPSLTLMGGNYEKTNLNISMLNANQTYYMRNCFNVGDCAGNIWGGKLWRADEDEPVSWMVNRTGLTSAFGTGTKIGLTTGVSNVGTIAYTYFGDVMDYYEFASPPPEANDTINISATLPATSSSFNTVLLNLNATVNATNIFNCSLYVNSTLNQTKNNLASGSNIPVGFNLSFGSTTEQSYSYYFSCYDSETMENSTSLVFTIDNTAPSLTDSSLTGNNTYWTNVLGLAFNVTDPFLENITIVDSCGYSYTNTSPLNPFVYSENLNITGCGLGVKQTNITACDGINCYSETFTWYAMARLNISATSAILGTAIENFTIYLDGTLAGTATGPYFNLDNLSSGSNNVSIIATGYELKSNLATITQSYGTYDFSLYGSNSILIKIYNEDLGTLITTNVTIKFSSTLQEFTNNSNNTFYIDNLNATEWQITFSGGGFTARTYTVTVGDGTFQNLNAYLTNSTDTTLFTISDSASGSWY